jgi:uncharacterized membrane protein YedE/YeeE
MTERWVSSSRSSRFSSRSIAMPRMSTILPPIWRSLAAISARIRSRSSRISSGSFGLDIGPRAASVWFGLALGLVFGALAFLTRFCLRRALVGPVAERASARGVWAQALAVALIGTQATVAAGWIAFDAHRFHAASLPVLLLVAGGLLFGIGAVLARGCITRLTVLAGGGNLRALTGLVVFAVAAHATLQGVLAPLRTGFATLTVSPSVISLGDLPGVLAGLRPVLQERVEPLVGQRVLGQRLDHVGRRGRHVGADLGGVFTWFTVRIEAARICVSKP